MSNNSTLLSLRDDERKKILKKGIEELISTYKDAYLIFNRNNTIPDPYNVKEKLDAQILTEEDEEALMEISTEDLFLIEVIMSCPFLEIIEEKELNPNKFLNELHCDILERDAISPFYNLIDMVTIGLMILDLKRLMEETNSIFLKEFDYEELEEFKKWFIEPILEDSKNESVLLGDDIYSMLVFLLIKDLEQ